MTLYFEQQDQENVAGRRIIPRLASLGDDGIELPPQVSPPPMGWEVMPPPPPSLSPTVARRWSAAIRGDDVDTGDDARIVTWRFVGWEVQPVQPPAFSYRQRHASILFGDAADINDQAPIIFQFKQGWEVAPVQPPVPSRKASAVSAAIALGDPGTQAIFVPPWVFASPLTAFPDSQANPAAATPSYNAGAQVGSVKSKPNITTQTVLKAAPGYLFTVSVVVAGTTAGGAYDSAANALVNQFGVIPNTVGIYLFEWPCQQGILLAPGAGQTIAAKWA